MKILAIIILLLFLQSNVFGQTHAYEQYGQGLCVSLLNTTPVNISELTKNVIPGNSLPKKNQSTGCTVGQALIVGGSGIVLGMAIVYGFSSEPSGGGGVLLINNEQKKIYEIIAISGLGIAGAGIEVLIISKKYERKHPERFFSMIGTRDHVGLAYNF